METEHKSVPYGGVFNSFKVKELIPYKTQIEQDYLHDLEFNESVTSFRSIGSPLQKTLRYNFPYIPYIPCFFVCRENQQEFVLLDPGNVDSATLRIVASRSEEVCCINGFKPMFLTRKDFLPQETCLRNIKLLYKHAAAPFSSDDMFAVSALLQSKHSGMATIGELDAVVGDKDAIYALLHHRALLTNLFEDITDQTEVWGSRLLNYFLQSVVDAVPPSLAASE